MDDDFDHYAWHVGDPEDWGDGPAGVPDIPYMGHINNGDDDDETPPRPNPQKMEAERLSDEAWRLEDEGRYEEALRLINQAIGIYPHIPNDFNRKAIILQDMYRYDEALAAYDRALSLNPKSRVISNNKAECIMDAVKEKKYSYSLTRRELDLINEALKILPDDKDRSPYLRLKGNILDELGEHVNAKICYLLSSRMFDEVDEAEKQIKLMKDPKVTHIRIVGTSFHQSFEPFHKGVIVNLIREPDNRHDPDAIRVEIEGESVGYVANSPKTLIENVKSATELKNSNATQAIFSFILLGEYVIARVI